ncbi:elongation factor G-binding protein [Neobacillus niacini]|uniref:FusB/FusC family EF-G-binding protein n=1 Tax=Neobacillus niacini TaxID=86668 RepID=UPI00052F946B|nr:elongation factor G-binding protein [Neobacillus niacini]KGM46273.1 fibronectin-binding protein [Neobacillus niacini]MEC1525647.1 elongation factor G-binding protein [Neobacillus niacini]
MTEKFIKNEQLNFIKKQIAFIKDSTKKNIPQNVLASVIELANAKILEHFPNVSLEQQEMLNLSNLKTDKEYEQYIQHLSGYLLPFPTITEQQLKKMFPKHKKLKLPDLSTIDHSQLTYLSWNDLRSNKKFIVYELEGEMVGIECEFAPTSKKNLCSFCNSFGEVAYFSTVTKAKKSNNPDYYKAIGNLICADSCECNKKITNVDYLASFLEDSLGK